jgi:hypothetical protein
VGERRPTLEESIMEAQADQDAEHLKLLSIFHYVVAAMMAMFATFPIIHFLIGLVMISGATLAPKETGLFPAVFGGFFVLAAGGAMLFGWSLAVCTLLAGRSLAQRRRYYFCLVVAGAMAAMCMPFGTVLGVFTIIVLQRPSVKEAFGVPPASGVA